MPGVEGAVQDHSRRSRPVIARAEGAGKTGLTRGVGLSARERGGVRRARGCGRRQVGPGSEERALRSARRGMRAGSGDGVTGQKGGGARGEGEAATLRPSWAGAAGKRRKVSGPGCWAAGKKKKGSWAGLMRKQKR